MVGAVCYGKAHLLLGGWFCCGRCFFLSAAYLVTLLLAAVYHVRT